MVALEATPVRNTDGWKRELLAGWEDKYTVWRWATMRCTILEIWIWLSQPEIREFNSEA